MSNNLKEATCYIAPLKRFNTNLVIIPVKKDFNLQYKRLKDSEK